MPQTGHNLNLATESIRPDGRSDVIVQNLDRDHSSVVFVARKEDRGHSSPPELALDIIPILECSFQMIAQIGHAGWVKGYTSPTLLLSCRQRRSRFSATAGPYSLRELSHTRGQFIEVRVEHGRYVKCNEL